MIPSAKHLTIAAIFATSLTSVPATAQDLTLQGIITTQTQFRALSDDLGAALSYKAQTPAEPLGITGFDVGIAATSTKLGNASQAALENKSSLIIPTVRAHKGLPLGFDIGAAYAAADGIRYVGGELRYALLDGGTLTPAIGLRGSMTRLTGVDELDFDTKGVDLSISKGFAFITPYAGIGRVWVSSTPKPGLALATEDFSLDKYYVGVGLNVLLMNLNLEADKTGEATSYSAKLGIRF